MRVSNLNKKLINNTSAYSRPQLEGDEGWRAWVEATHAHSWKETMAGGHGWKLHTPTAGRKRGLVGVDEGYSCCTRPQLITPITTTPTSTHTFHPSIHPSPSEIVVQIVTVKGYTYNYDEYFV